MPIPTNFSIKPRVSAKKRAFNQIQEWIIDGTLIPGEKLNDADLAQALGVSRTPIREALQLLTVQGFVEMYPGVGTQVTALKKEDVSKILPPLAVLQALAAELATSVINQETIHLLRDINTRFAQSIKNGDSDNALKLDEQFHNIIVENAHNEYISSLVSTLQSHVFRLYYHSSIIFTKRSIEEHEAILSAFEEKNKVEAARLARVNWLHPVEFFYSEHKDQTNK
ncbi:MULTISPECIES: GntR family transcriptional regulator [Bacillaceae]|uniref:DNA-binding GntR family transcriptional regulator n=1 Tax=Peribacillus huizhouensis TaxID=1501239 RepID=A0ABR6CUQ8_9BACI|nr:MULTISPECIES: GntR family transcriptional regulator [Bacillaceae]MBA9028758.1 DNA-binding GntR family transcriptional regulator [Peribacillus huizhouensis]